MKKYFTLNKAPLAFAVLASLSFSVVAEETMDTVVVTANRTEQKLSETLSAITVITRDDIERLQPQDVASLLRREAGLDLSRAGGKGATTGVFLHGAAANQTIVLIDGVRTNTVSDGQASIEFLDLEQIERIEIVRGPSTTLYGNDAIGGVIQIFTRKGGEKPRTTVTAGWGSRGAQQHAFNHSGRADAFSYNINQSYESTNGINASVYDPDHDAFHSENTAIALGYDIDGGHTLGLNYNRTEGESEYDVGEVDLDRELISGKGSFQIADNIKSSLTASLMKDEKDSGVIFDTQRDNVLWQTDIETSKGNTLVTGLEYTFETLDSTTAFTDDDRRNKAIFLQDTLAVGRQTFQAGARHDSNSQYGTEKTWNLGYGYAVTDSVNFFASYGTAFKAPTFNDLYFPLEEYCSFWGFNCFYVGNPDVQPEHSRSGELGFKGQAEHYFWSASVYRNEISNLIVWEPISFGPGPFDSTTSAVNINDAVIEGMDLSGGITVDQWRFGMSASLLNPKDANSGGRLRRRAKSKLSVDIDRTLSEQLSAGISWTAQGNRPDKDSNTGETIMLAGYNTVDLRASYMVTKALKLSLSVENVFDNEYTTANDFYNLGRTAMIKAAYTF